MTYYLKKGNCFSLSDEESLDIYKTLPPNNFIIKQDQWGNIFLEKVDSFDMPKKVYGDTLKNTNRIFNTFVNRTASTGVLLAGEKGSGKTLLAKSLAVKCQKNNIPTILINSPWMGDTFNKLIQDITQPCMVLFDEFEKVYNKDEQQSMLTLLDGVYPSKKLFVLTCNDKWRVDMHLRNRPGRIFYMLDFNGLEDNFIVEYCEDNVKNKKHIPAIIRISKIFSDLNFDMLKAIVEEVNRYDEAPTKFLNILNTKPEFNPESTFLIELTVNGKKIDSKNLSDKTWNGNPIVAKEISISTSNNKGYVEYFFGLEDLNNFDSDANKYTFKNAKNEELILTKENKRFINPFVF